jgi:hypothetical protein
VKATSDWSEIDLFQNAQLATAYTIQNFLYYNFFNDTNSRSYRGWGVMLTTNFHPVLGPRMVELYLHNLTGLHDVVRNQVSTGAIT